MVVVSEPRPTVAQLIAQAKRADEPVILTTNGEPELVLMTPTTYQALLDRIELLDSVVGLYKAELQFERGECRPAREALEELGRQHGILP